MKNKTRHYLSELRNFKVAQAEQMRLEDIEVLKRGRYFTDSDNLTDYIGTYVGGFTAQNKYVEIPLVDVHLVVALLIAEGGDKVRYTEAVERTYEEGGYYNTPVKGEFTSINYKLADTPDSQFNFWNPIVKEIDTEEGHFIEYLDGHYFIVK